MEEKLAAAPLDHTHKKMAYHAVTYGWLLSGLARAVTGKGMRELFREELALPLDIDGLHLGRPPADSPTTAAQTLLPQANIPTPVLDFVAPKVAGLSFSGLLGSIYFRGSCRCCRAICRFSTASFPLSMAWSPRVGWPRCTGRSPMTASSMGPDCCPPSWSVNCGENPI
ncbi:hypothetical protein NIIDMKKI_33280 [Mycobacterium kansasii]|uniref:Beta-lactamase-related domain-containing protein n=1 Tax=Mycobacterium kansasii TaxID=1768 RepID=A0A7G1IE09_MYCKA|nr:hypothetical protein NIIDMKKI_33280 [Mycobacterium kansasii]